AIMADDYKSVMIDWLEDEDDEVRKHIVTPEEVFQNHICVENLDLEKTIIVAEVTMEQMLC
ncbi:hypothetical protein FRX31_035116, partial [Thalictrum thalictroides]